MTPATPNFPANRSASLARFGRLIVFALSALTLALAVLYWNNTASSPSKSFILFFSSSIENLSVGSPVKMGGVSIGRVASIGLRSPHDTQTAFHVAVNVKIAPDRFAPHDTPAPDTSSWLNREIKHGLCAKLALLSPSTGTYYIELGYEPNTPHPLVSSPTERLNEIPVVNRKLSNKEIRTYADWLTLFSEKDFDKLKVEWDSTLDNFLEPLAPERINAFNAATIDRLDKINHLLRNSHLREDCRKLNATLPNLIPSLENADTNTLLHWLKTDARPTLAELRLTLSHTTLQIAQIATLLDAHSTEVRTLLDSLSSIRKTCQTLRTETPPSLQP
ncbi:MAG: MlaD family protein [Puniceicoccales bacterium]|jgi:paraquat-inducible protein B|nr:MlaD family protein [Puniceicoccales bacterium]